MSVAKPFLKSLGGKRQLLGDLLPLMPDNEYVKYVEPFIGGGALFFAEQPFKAKISDVNIDIIRVYQAVQRHPRKLIALCKMHQEKNSKEYFLEMKKYTPDVYEFNLTERQKRERASLLMAARFLYLNKTAYSGITRYNSSGMYNAPYANYPNPKIAVAEDIMAAHEVLKGTKIAQADFHRSCKSIREGSFVYFDPPYITTTNGFTQYTAKGFSIADQWRLRQLAVDLANKGCYVMVSNSDNEVTKAMWSGTGFYMHQVKVNRAINSDASNRSGASELIFTSYRNYRG